MNNLKLARSLYFLGIFILCFVVFMSLFFFLNYVHETGHMVFGFLDGLIKGNLTTFTIGAWMNHPFFHFIKLPQQTKIASGAGSLNFAMGGPILVILIFLGISIFAYLRSKNKLWFLLLLSILIFEISGNIICGTDNFYSVPLSLCNHKIDLFLQYLSIGLFSAIFSYFIIDSIKPFKP